MKNGSITATLMQWVSSSVPVNLLKSPLKNRFGSKIMCFWWNFESVLRWKFVPNGRAVDADLYSQQLERVREVLRWSYPSLVNRNRVLLQQENARPHTARTTMTKFRNWEDWNCYLTQHTALILCLQITICFDSWPISCVEEISKTL